MPGIGRSLAAWIGSLRRSGGAVTLNPPVNAELPEISGDLTVNGILTVSDGLWTGAPTTYLYQWLIDAVEVPSAVSNLYSVAEADIGGLVSATVTAVNEDGETAATSAQAGPVAGIVPENTVAPSITGGSTPPLVGQTLTAVVGTWTGTPYPAFTYQWKSDGSAIAGATTATYKLTVGEDAELITVTVTGTNSAGADSATSASVGPVDLGDDILGPTLSGCTVTVLSNSTATFEVTTDEGGGILYGVVVPTAAAAPDAAQIVAGTDGDDVAAIWTGTIEVAGVTTYGPEIMSPLGAGDTYDLYLVHYDAEDNASNVVSDEFTQTGGVTPLLTAFSIVDYHDDFVRFTVTTDTANGNFYAVVVPTAAVAPNVAQIEAGTDGSGNPAAATASLAITSSGAKSIDIDGLDVATTYDLYMFHEAQAGGDSAIETDEFTTDAALVITGATAGLGTGFTAGSGCSAIATAVADSDGGNNAISVTDIALDPAISGSFVLSFAVPAYGVGTNRIRFRFKLVSGSGITWSRVATSGITGPSGVSVNLSTATPGVTNQQWLDEEIVYARDNGFYEFVGTVTLTGPDYNGSLLFSFGNGDSDLTLIRDGTHTVALHNLRISRVS
jgi:hypothetical protein